MTRVEFLFPSGEDEVLSTVSAIEGLVCKCQIDRASFRWYGLLIKSACIGNARARTTAISILDGPGTMCNTLAKN